MGKLILRLLITALSLFAISQLVPGISVSSFQTALLVAFLLAILNLFVRPVMLILTLPINILTLGLFTFVINGLMFWIVSFYVPGFRVSTFSAAIIGALGVSILSWVGDVLVNEGAHH